MLDGRTIGGDGKLHHAERNAHIFNLHYRDGIGTRPLARMFNLSRERIYHILEQQEQRVRKLHSGHYHDDEKHALSLAQTETNKARKLFAIEWLVIEILRDNVVDDKVTPTGTKCLELLALLVKPVINVFDYRRKESSLEHVAAVERLLTEVGFWERVKALDEGVSDGNELGKDDDGSEFDPKNELSPKTLFNWLIACCYWRIGD